MRSQINNLQYHTSFILIVKEGYDKGLVEKLIESNPLIEGKIDTKFNCILFPTIYPITGREKKFEQAKVNFIYQLYDISDYISILFDSQTVNYMQEISKIIYNLEREFRALIEISFLKQKGKGWYKNFYQDNEKEKNRLDKRPDVIKKIYNPLDNRDFVDLSNFVKKNVSTSKNTIFQKLESVESLFEQYREEAQSYPENLTLIQEKLDEIKKATDHKNQGLSYNNLYEHLTPALAIEWKELYDKRNLWAHNYCLFTSEELNRFKYLSKIVMRKIRTEITLLSFLNDEDKPFIISGDLVNLKLYKMKSEGTTICKLKIKISVDSDDNRLLEVSKATYSDIIKISKIFAEFSDNTDYARLLGNIGSNPFLSEIIRDTIISIINSDKFKAKLKVDFESLKCKLDKEYFNEIKQEKVKNFIKKIDKKESKMDDDLDTLLQQIF
ncbi:hypothetical protein [Peribacillus simplex]|uniref:hypothetical protein n=1 Tax=Peribacillus simplex TaxID=1478 RepID=UPI003CE7E750